MILPFIGAEGQERIGQAHVVVIGAGGLGCPVLQYLAGAGIGHITLLDPDHVEESNLHRQPLFTMADLGRSKAVAARDRILASNPGIRIDARIAALTPANAPALVATADVVIDAADSFAVSYTLSDACLAARIPLISASVLGQSGYVGGFCGPAPSLRAVFPDPPETSESCATAGVLGPAVGAIGAVQAQLALRTVIDASPGPLGRMLTLDFGTFSFGGFGFMGQPEPACPLPFIASSMLRDGDRVIELRGRAEAPKAITRDAVRISPDAVARLPAGTAGRTVLCCATGLRAWRAAQVLQNRGFRDLALIAARADA
ncbi:ThiF family adenylyltransferase [Paracoccus aurantiacus]